MVFRAMMSPRGQLVIPAKIRKRMGLKGRTQISLIEEDDQLVLRPCTPESIAKMAGMLGTGGRATKMLLEERARDREREDRRQP